MTCFLQGTLAGVLFCAVFAEEQHLCKLQAGSVMVPEPGEPGPAAVISLSERPAMPRVLTRSSVPAELG